KYCIDAKLGAGGMGAVFRARRLLIGDEVAIKILHPEHVEQPQSVERFRREAQAAARLKHPNAVTIYDFGVTSDGLVYLVMELVEGQSLRQIIKQQGPLTPSAAAEVINQVCAALDEAHRQQIVHRDLKPDNIIVNPTLTGLRTKVLDFGIAKLRDLTAGNLTQTGSVMGTPHYMSPEQCLGEELDSRSDIYSLGIVLYEMLAGVVPFNSPTSTAVVVQHVNQAPPSLRAINVSISLEIERIVMHALEKKREARPQTAGALAEELNAAVRGPAVLPVVTPVEMPPHGHAAPPTMAPTMVMRTPVSGSVPVRLSSAGVSGAPQRAWLPQTDLSGGGVGKRNVMPIVLSIAVVGLLVASVAIYFLFFSFSAKRAVLDEVKKGNLVKPEGSSAYDLYTKHKQDLTAKEKEEITNEAAPKLERRGDEIFTSLKQEQTESEDQWAEAIRLYNWLNELRPNPTFEAKIYFSQASLAFARKDYNAALPAYQRAAQRQPNWALALNRLGRVYVNLKDKGSAREYYRQATVAEPAWLSPWINFGAICLDMNDPYSAEPALRQAIGIDSQKASAHYLLAQALEKQGRLCEAFQEYSTTLELVTANPTNTVNSDALQKKILVLESKYVCGGD
ncbi:MAG TPA: protein kinase, partial [Pyrinomonadaceae bacterium]|nr:protein kinase [Pyrinomonadaceae bacterium]